MLLLYEQITVFFRSSRNDKFWNYESSIKLISMAIILQKITQINKNCAIMWNYIFSLIYIYIFPDFRKRF